MKNRFIYAGIAVLFTLSLPGCSDEANNDGTTKVPEEMTNVRIALKTDFKTRSETRAPTTDLEKKYDASHVNLYVYKENGTLELKQENVDFDSGEDVVIRITTGKKYFYAFVNTGNLSDAIVGKSMRGEFEKQIQEIKFEDVLDVDNPNLAGYPTDSRNFFMGTLWGVPEVINSGHDTDVILNIGRITAKVILHEVQKGAYPDKSTMPGTFSDFKYRIGGVPNLTYLVGQYTPEGTTPPGTYTKVTSAVHYEKNVLSDGKTPNPVFRYYDTYKTVTALDSKGDPVDNYFYVIENTTDKPDDDYQYYHNTTHIRLQSKYTPLSSEVHNLALESGQALLGDGTTFWTIVKDGVRYIVNEDPTDVIDPDEDTEIYEYRGGINYHKFPVQDINRSENDVEARNSVLRNHYYEINVTSIKDLGSSKDDIDPTIPIPEDLEVTMKVNVLDWSKITQPTDI